MLIHIEFFNENEILGVWKTRFEKYIIPLFDIISFKNKPKNRKNDIIAMWKIQNVENVKM